MKVSDVVLDAAACVHLHGKGRKERSVPLWRSTVKAIRAWLRFNADLGPTSALLPNRGGQAMTRSNVTQRLALAVKAASYLQLRHSLGFKLRDAGLQLPRFVAFLEERQADYVTVSLSLEWAQRSPNVKPAEWARRLGYRTRRFRSGRKPLKGFCEAMDLAN